MLLLACSAKLMMERMFKSVRGCRVTDVLKSDFMSDSLLLTVS